MFFPGTINGACEKVTYAVSKNKKLAVLTPNPEILVASSKSPLLDEAMKCGDLFLADGTGLILGCFLKHPFKKIPFKIIHGIDFMLELCRQAEKRHWQIGLVGGKNSSAAKTKTRLLKMFPNLDVLYVAGDFDFDPQTNQSSPPLQMPIEPLDIVFVALGTPKEQVWINNNKTSFPAKVFVEVGGAFDIISGALPRAPRFLRFFGLEWLWRLFLQPSRCKRQLELIKFLFNPNHYFKNYI